MLAMNATTSQTRRESFHNVQSTLGKRQRDVLATLKYLQTLTGNPVTANELASYMSTTGLTPSSDRNTVHPRLHELVETQLVSIIGKRICSVSKRSCATYSAVNI